MPGNICIGRAKGDQILEMPRNIGSFSSVFSVPPPQNTCGLVSRSEFPEGARNRNALNGSEVTYTQLFNCIYTSRLYVFYLI